MKNRTGFGAILVAIVWLTASTALAQTNWTKLNTVAPASYNWNSPVAWTNDGRLGTGTTGYGDVTDVQVGPAVIAAGTNYWLWYTGLNAANTYAIFHAYDSVSNGMCWVKYNNEAAPRSNVGDDYGRIPLGESGAGDDERCYSPCVVRDGDALKMWYCGKKSGDTVVRIYCATSSVANPLVWRKVNNALPPTSNTTGTDGRLPEGTGLDAGGVRGCSVLIEPDGTYKMWYDGLGGSTWRIFHATSTNGGMTWTKYGSPTPVLNIGSSGAADAAATAFPAVIKVGSSYMMWYSGSSGSYRILMATSSNGINWVKVDNSIESASNDYGTNGRIPLGLAGRGDAKHTLTQAVLREGDTLRMWYGGQDLAGGFVGRLFYATSPLPTTASGISFSIR